MAEPTEESTHQSQQKMQADENNSTFTTSSSDTNKIPPENWPFTVPVEWQVNFLQPALTTDPQRPPWEGSTFEGKPALILDLSASRDASNRVRKGWCYLWSWGPTCCFSAVAMRLQPDLVGPISSPVLIPVDAKFEYKEIQYKIHQLEHGRMNRDTPRLVPVSSAWSSARALGTDYNAPWLVHKPTKVNHTRRCVFRAAAPASELLFPLPIENPTVDPRNIMLAPNTNHGTHHPNTARR